MLPHLLNTALGVAEIGANRLLSLDSKVLEQCRALNSRCVAIHISDLDRTLYCHPGTSGMRLSWQSPSKPVDATISGRMMALINLALEEDKISTSIEQRVDISGDAAVAQQFQKILTQIDIDWEEQLSTLTGDVLAYRINQQLQSGRDWLRQSLDSLQQNSAEYMQHEVSATPNQSEYEHFRDELTVLRADVERSEARLRELSRQLRDKQKA